MKLRKEGMIMERKWKVFWAICIIVCLTIVIFPQKPKLISNITTLDTAYITILVDKRELRNIKKLENELLKMCIEDTFEGMKLNTENRTRPENLHISVYAGRGDLKKGIVAYVFKYNEGDH